MPPVFIVREGVAAERAVSKAPEATEAALRLLGQLHHAISVPVWRFLERHPIPRGVFRARDPRFTTKAIDKAAHNGYDAFNRALDAEIKEWIRDHPQMTPDQFVEYLRSVYQRPEVRAHYPQGLP